MTLFETDLGDRKLASAGEIFLPLARFRLVFRARRGIRFSEFAGSAWRGALGHALRNIACTTGLPECRTCPERFACTYTEVFETPPPTSSEKMRKYPNVPHPFVLTPETVAMGARDCCLGLTVIGKGSRHVSVLIRAFVEAAAGPKGIAGNRMWLHEVKKEQELGSQWWEKVGTGPESVPFEPPDLKIADAAAAIPPCPDSVILRFLTPLRVKRDGKHVGAAELRFGDVFVNLMRRISMLSYFHTVRPLETDFRSLAEMAKSVEAETQLEWRDLGRYSSRQNAAMQMGGVIGSMRVQDARLAQFWPYLWLGQWIHAGTGATMGLGRYTVHSSSSNANHSESGSGFGMTSAGV